MNRKLSNNVIAAFLPLLLIMATVIAGCALNQSPTAYIDSIVPDEATHGEAVAFTGHGTDSDGTVVGYRWTSSIDGEIGTSASFTTSSLSVGSHTISFRAQDNNGAWSGNVTATVIVTEAIPEPAILSFDADPGIINPGGTSNLSWEVTGAATVHIDQGVGSVALSGTRDVSPGETTIYTLTATNEAGSVNATVQITVQEDTTPPGTPVLTSPAEGATLPQPSEAWSFDWNDSSDPESGIAGYQIYVIHEGAGSPVINASVTDSECSEIVGGQITHEYLDNWTWTVRAQNNAGLWSPWSAVRTFSVEPKITGTLTISQLAGIASAWFGASPAYVNVGQGQSFQVTEAGFFHQFWIYLTSSSSSNSGDIIVCDLRDASGSVLQSSSINGFTAGNGGWQIFNFNLETYVTPGTYYCTCYVSNPISGHNYGCHGNSDDTSYPEGARYHSTGGDLEDWSTWHSSLGWDLFFKAIIKTGP
jgi:hypothetical protein